jgi:hypothetical protein
MAHRFFMFYQNVIVSVTLYVIFSLLPSMIDPQFRYNFNNTHTSIGWDTVTYLVLNFNIY